MAINDTFNGGSAFERAWASAAAVLLALGAAGGAGAVSLTRPAAVMAPTIQTPIAKLSAGGRDRDGEGPRRRGFRQPVRRPGRHRSNDDRRRAWNEGRSPAASPSWCRDDLTMARSALPIWSVRMARWTRWVPPVDAPHEHGGRDGPGHDGPPPPPPGGPGSAPPPPPPPPPGCDAGNPARSPAPGVPAPSAAPAASAPARPAT